MLEEELVVNLSTMLNHSLATELAEELAVQDYYDLFVPSYNADKYFAFEYLLKIAYSGNPTYCAQIIFMLSRVVIDPLMLSLLQSIAAMDRKEVLSKLCVLLQSTDNNLLMNYVKQLL